MSKERDEKFDPSQPALIVKHGNSKRKHRPMDREVLVLGRAPGCDVGLDAPDVSPVHCVIVRAADGWRVRDCTGKGGTRVNGQSIQDAVLADEDVLQVGSFSFALHLPPDHQPLSGAEAPTDRALGRARRSRHNLARLALRLRGRVAEMESAAVERADEQLTARQDELDRQTEQLRALQLDVDARFGDLKQAAQDVAARNAALEERRRRVEQESAQLRAETDAAVRASVEACQAHCRALEEAHGRALAEKERPLRQSIDDASRDLEIRAREAACYSGYLRRLRQRLNEHEESLTVRWEEWLREQQEASIAQARQSEKIVREEATLREQRAEVVRLLLMGEMRQMRQQPDPRAEALREENEQLRRHLVEREAEAASAREQARLRAEEAEELRGRLSAEEDAGDDSALRRFVVELDTGRRILDEQIREVQGRFIDMERAAREAETLIARERERMSAERQELERLRGGLWPGDGRSPGAETLVDMPSPLRHLPEMAPADDASGATG